MNIQIDEYKLSLADHRESCRIYNGKALETWFSIFTSLAVICLCVVIVGIGQESVVLFIVAACVAVLAVIAAHVRFVMFPFMVPKSIYAGQQQYRNPRLFMDDQGIRSRSDAGEGSIKWEAVLDLKESHQGIVICLPGKTWLYIPHRYLTSNDRRELRDWFAISREESDRPSLESPK